MIFGNGHYAVAAFIVISGFCLGMPIVRAGGVLRGGALRFYARRARRILPPYYLAFFLSVAFTTMLRDHNGNYWDLLLPVDRNGYLGHLLLVQDHVGGLQADPPLWSVAVEWRIYLLLPLVVLAFRYLRPVTVVVGSIALGYFGFIVAVAYGFASSNVQFFGLFVLGMFAAKAAFSQQGHWPTIRIRTPWLPLAATFGVSIVAAHHFLHGGGDWGARYFLDLPLGLFMVGLLVAGADPDSRLSRVLGFRPLAFIGAFSYSVYLIHVPLLALLWQHIFHPLGLEGGRAGQCLSLCSLSAFRSFSPGATCSSSSASGRL
jgi:peptidoglycan/LPS O-acetylase OafA/YrhL